MILVDTQIWIDHFHEANLRLNAIGEAEDLLCHPLIIAELAMGSLKNREETLENLWGIPMTEEVEITELLHFVDREALFSKGIGVVDATLLASCLIDPQPIKLWTRDRRLNTLADQFGIAYQPLH